MNISRFAAGFGRRPSRTPSFGVQRQRKAALPAAALHHYWYPDRPGAEPAPSAVAKALLQIHPSLRLVKPPASAPIHTGFHPWIVWFRNPEVRHPLCPGWQLVMIWEHPDTHEPLPLDNRLYANCYMRDPRRFENGKAYFNGCVDAMVHDDDVKKRDNDQLTHDMGMDIARSRQIKNIGHGSKFALHHDGTNIPTKSELNWRTETLYDRLPPKVRADAEKEGHNTRRRVSNSTDAGTRGEHRAFQKEAQTQLEILKLLKDRRERVRVLASRRSVSVR